MKKTKFMTLLAIISMLCTIPHIANAASTPKFTDVYKTGNHVKLEWTTEMATNDIITQTGFESGNEIPNLLWRSSNGNQVITNSPTNGKALQLTDTISGKTGNYYNPPASDSIRSVHLYSGKSVPGGSTLSINYKAFLESGTTGYSYIALVTGVANKGYDLVDNSGNVVKFKNTTDFSNLPSRIEVYTSAGSVNLTNGAEYNLVTSRDTNYGYGMSFYEWDNSNQVFKLKAAYSENSPLGQASGFKRESFAAGSSVLTYKKFTNTLPTRNITQRGQWIDISTNIDLSNSTDYDYINRGVIPRFYWQTDGKFYIDDVKIGYATEVEVFRNNASIYRGYLSDYTDTMAVDKAKPNAPTNIKMTVGTNNKPTITWTASSDLGSTYNYQIKGYPKNEPVTSLSNNSPITITSGIKGYAVVIDQNPTTNPGNIINTTSTSFTDNKIIPSGKIYAHIAAIDNEGNISNTVHQELYYNTIPTLTVNQNNLQANNSQSIKLTGTIQDIDNDPVTISASVAGVTKQVTISNTAALQNWTLEWSGNELTEGIYSNIAVTASDGK